MLALKVMEVLRRGPAASFLAVCAAFIALQCGQEEFDLLPTGQAAGGQNAAGGANSTGGGGFSNQPPSGSGGWSEPSHPACPPRGPCWCENDEGCEPFSDFPYCVGNRCVECKTFSSGESVGCLLGKKCDRSFCRAACRGGFDDCPHGSFCDVEFQRYTCVECDGNSDCEGDGSGDYCFEGRCADCQNNSHCPGDEFCWYGVCYEVP
jgi:hypothetical protein